MKSVDVKLNGMDQVRTFVNITNRYPFVIELRQGRAVIDAKSILGIISLDRTKPVTMDIYSDCCDPLIDDIERVIA